MKRFFKSIAMPALAYAWLLAMGGTLLAIPGGLRTAQDGKGSVQKQEEGKVPGPKELEKEKKKQEKGAPDQPKLTTGEAIVELAIVAYGGRTQLDLVRASIHEQGTIRLATDQGEITGSYSLRSVRREKSWQDLLRVDLELAAPEAAARAGNSSSVAYTIAFNGGSIWSAQNNQYITARPEVETAFRAQLVHEYGALLRYKEDGSKVELIGPEMVVGIATNIVELTLPDGQKTRYWISAKTFRILHAEYQLTLIEGQPPVSYRISYYYTPLRVVQNTLVPVRRVMTQNGKFVQEITINSATYSAKLDPEIFQHLQT